MWVRETEGVHNESPLPRASKLWCCSNPARRCDNTGLPVSVDCPYEQKIWTQLRKHLMSLPAYGMYSVIFPQAQRVYVLRQFARLLSPNGIVFIDVNHRYNMREYGFLKTVGRMALDYLLPNERNGDVIARWTLGEMTFATSGHVFTDREFTRLSHKAGLEIRKRISVDYRSGQVRRSPFGGNLLYCLA